MAVLSLQVPNSLNSILFSPSPPSWSFSFSFSNGGRLKRGKFVVLLSTHSNPKILKSNKKSKYGQRITPYDTDEEEEAEDEEFGKHYDMSGDDWLMNDGFAETHEFGVNGKIFKSQKGSGNQRLQEKVRGSKALKSRQGLITAAEQMDVRNGNDVLKKSSAGNVYQTSNKMKEVGSFNRDGRGKSLLRTTENKYQRLSDEIDLDEKWLPLLDYLSTFGLKESHFIQMYERHMPSLQINVCSAQERLEYLLSVGVKQRDIRRILLRQPQILEYTVENNLKPRVAFLMGLGIPNSRIGQIIASAPSLFSYSVENSLKPTVRYLIEEVGIKEADLGKVVQLSPQILVQRIDISWNTRYMFLSKELGAPRDSVVKMVRKHPQLLHYSIDDGLLPRINFLRSIGMRNSDILKVLTSLTQVLSLSLEDNLKPKYMYLVNELNNEVHSLTKYPMYLSLSLDQRIRPRHRFLVSLKKAPKGPFPLGSFVPTDECFCQQWAGTSLDKYLAFRQRLLLKEFAKKYEKQ
ncbi:Mitochodrial transcription termination factor-related protein [Corchorus capsularis]|uniref:Mitochodrial transcription termination factor-related protein n=1 Tax=Corchorus capsularis TaxID=210143 RepID=A0A1R3IM72_COCAP|nr:Mitochodrial transcription termination factor-related protein [Corchorus capsularis]